MFSNHFIGGRKLPKTISVLVKPASGRCNASCKYCFYKDEASLREQSDFGLMSLETAENLIAKALDFSSGGRIFFTFQGGEPTLAGLDFFKRFVAAVNEKNLSGTTVFYGLQTNGSLLTEAWAKFFKDNDKPLEAERIAQRTNFDIEMIQELGYCSGVENYSRIISGRPVGSAPMTLLDYFPKDFLLFIDESHVTLPQVRAMYHGDRARKEALVEYGFRLPSAFDNRPLKFEEFQQRINQVIYVSATPGEYERTRSGQIAEQIIRPTGLTDPKTDVRPIEGQIDDLIAEIHTRIDRGERTLVTTLTKRMAEDLTAYLGNAGIKTRYMHHDIGAMERMEIIRDLRRGEFDVLVGINLLREGLDLPEVSLIAILDADKEGFLRSETSLIQTIGRAARNAEGTVIMYADTVTPSMRAAIDETERRRAIQTAYNEAHGIVPKTIKKSIRDLLEITGPAAKDERGMRMTERERRAEIDRLEKEMRKAAQMLEYEYAAVLRDQIIRLRGEK